MQCLAVDRPGLIPPACFQRPQGKMPTDMAMQLPLSGVSGIPSCKIGEALLALPLLVEQMGLDVRGVCVARKAAKGNLDIPEAAVELLQLDFGKRQYRSKPPVVAVMRSERLEHRELLH